ncbi:hypothetical protein BGZ99_002199 [Dissophora globulifera]|uniref:Uncharacterized protein n=1 Tax=Dissophora globulifera TaxID=979702 RepID=A0A9P6UXG5_9FUNG|nr:hypothetical protein BGZ99_002199 [Dissophora globulifera]
MHRVDQGRHVQDTIAAFSRLMVDSKTSNKSEAVLPQLTFSTPPVAISVPDTTATAATNTAAIVAQVSSISPLSLPAATLSTPSSTLLASSHLSCTSASSPSSSATPYIASTVPAAMNGATSAVATVAMENQPPLLISQPIVPMSVIPAAIIVGTQSAPSCVSLGAIHGTSSSTSAGLAAMTSLLPLVGRDYLSYSSLNATLMATDAVVADNTPRPLSSMEYAESWLPTAIPNMTEPCPDLLLPLAPAQNEVATAAPPRVVEHITSNMFGTSTENSGQVHEGAMSRARVSSDRQSIHPLEMEPDTEEEAQVRVFANDSVHPLSQPRPLLQQSRVQQPQQQPQQQNPPQMVLRKKTSLAAKLRKVFVKQGPSSSVETQEDIMSLSSNDDDMKTEALRSNSMNISSTHPFAAVLDQHRGSVSSVSSNDTALGGGHASSSGGSRGLGGGGGGGGRAGEGLRRGSAQTVTPLTSPDTSPLSSPRIKANTLLSMSSLGQQLDLSEVDPSSLPSPDPISAPEENSAMCSGTSTPMPATFDASLKEADTNLAPLQIVIDDKGMLQPTPTRTVKKRLSFASISSFFGSKNGQERRTPKQQRSSSVPHVESPLTVVGRQIAGFQRRHSLNDLHDSNNNNNNKENQSEKSVANSASWDRGHGTPKVQQQPTPDSSLLASASTGAPRPPIAADATTRATPRKLSLNNVFKKQSKQHKKKGAATPLVSPAKPLKSALLIPMVLMAQRGFTTHVASRADGDLLRSGHRVALVGASSNSSNNISRASTLAIISNTTTTTLPLILPRANVHIVQTIHWRV